MDYWPQWRKPSFVRCNFPSSLHKMQPPPDHPISSPKGLNFSSLSWAGLWQHRVQKVLNLLSDFLFSIYTFTKFADGELTVMGKMKLLIVLLLSNADWTTSAFIGVLVAELFPCAHVQSTRSDKNEMIDGTDNCKVIKLLFSFSAWNSASNLASKKGLSIFFVLLRGCFKHWDKSDNQLHLQACESGIFSQSSC